MILVKGAGELASGIAWRLFRSGFAVVMTEVERPLAVRRTVSFCSAVYSGTFSIEGVTARLVSTVGEAAADEIPLLIDEHAQCCQLLRPTVVVDAIMAKRNLGTALTDAPVVVGVGPGFTAGVDCHAVVETQRGHTLGRVYYQGAAIPNTGVPAERGGHGEGRIVRVPAVGSFHGAVDIGVKVKAGDLLGQVDGVPVHAAIGGILRGLVHDGTSVTPGLKIGDVDPTGGPERCDTISDKALAVAGGVLEAVLCLQRRCGAHG